MSIIGSNILAGSSGQATGYNLNNSLRFRSSASAYLSRAPSSSGSQTTWTWSGWVKRGKLGAAQTFFGEYNANNDAGYSAIYFGSNDKLSFTGFYTVYLDTTQVFRDSSAWYHIVLAVDTTQATSTNRMKLYVNGVQVTAFSTANYPTLNATFSINNTGTHYLGFDGFGSGGYLDGYLAEVNFVNAQQLTPSSFGETSTTTGSWIPKRYTSTYGTNGFYLKFADASAATAAAIGKDSSGNGNNWTPSGISVTAGSTYDAMLDVPTNTSATVANYATLNPVYKAASQPTFSNANLTVAGNTNNYQNSYSTIAVTSGKWYAEIVVTGTPNSANMIGVSNQIQLNYLCSNADILGTGSGGTGYGYYIHDGRKYTATTASAYGNSIASGDIVGIALDLDNGKIWFSKNGTWQASGDPAAGTNAAFTGIASDTWSIGSTSYSTGATSFSHNFGQRPFTYTPPSGFVALNTYNLPTPTILQGNKYMDATLYTGTGATNAITNSGLIKPDFVWIKGIATAYNHALFDSVRGVNKILISNTTNVEATETAGSLSAFNSNGFTLASGSAAYAATNVNGESFVGWQWQAGQGTTTSNTSGTITSTVSVNATAGFSVATGTTLASGTLSIGHGLGVSPAMVIYRSRNTAGQNLWVWHKSLPNAATGRALLLNSTGAEQAGAYFGTPSVSSTVVTIAGAALNSDAFVLYSWAEIAGFSKFGSYTGNGSTDGPFVYTGFRPKFIMTKNATTAGTYTNINDTSRNTYNVTNKMLFPNDVSEELTNVLFNVDILSNGFKIRNLNNSHNTSSDTFIYMAFAENPFKNANAR